MVKEIQYTSINRVLDNLHDIALMDDVTLEQVVRHTIRFIGKNGFPNLYQDKQADVEIHNFRGVLPCDLISIIQVRNPLTGRCLRSMTDNFPDAEFARHGEPFVDQLNNVRHTPYIPPLRELLDEHSFKTQGRVLYTSFPEGMAQVAYKAIPVDDDGFPLLIDSEVYLSALESYITMKVLQNKFRAGKVPAQVYQDAQQEYAWEAAQLNSEMQIPSVSEMESISRMWNTMIAKPREFDTGFKHIGDREYLRKW